MSARRNGRRIQAAMVLATVAMLLLPSCRASRFPQVTCDDSSRQSLLHLVTQAVPSATLVPCIARLRTGWTYGGSEIRSGFVRFWLDSDRAGAGAVDVTLTRTCNVSGDTASGTLGGLHGTPVELVDAHHVRLTMYEEPAAAHPGVTVRHYVFTGGCATVRYFFTSQTSPTIYREAGDLLGYNLRSAYVAANLSQTGLSLCGAGAPPCPG